MDDQFHDDTTCGSIDSMSQGINITTRVESVEFHLLVNFTVVLHCLAIEYGRL
jgi:hypothetical protein